MIPLLKKDLLSHASPIRALDVVITSIDEEELVEAQFSGRLELLCRIARNLGWIFYTCIFYYNLFILVYSYIFVLLMLASDFGPAKPSPCLR